VVSRKPNRNIQPPRLGWKCYLYFTHGSEATLLLENLSEGVGVEGTISAPDSAADLLRQSVEWIVEDPSDDSSLFPFSDFGTVTFSNIAAGTSTGASLNLGYANTMLLDIVTMSGNTITGVGE
jgi:hypothetical protein